MLTYAGAHTRVRRLRGTAAGHWCARDCGRRAEQWAYDHADPDEICGRESEAVPELRVWSADPAHYEPLCRSCHTIADNAFRGIFGRDLDKARRRWREYSQQYREINRERVRERDRERKRRQRARAA